MKEFSIIVAYDENLGIGYNNALPWSIPEDLKRFATLTKGSGSNAVIMGRRTWESLPESYKPLPGRRNLIITNTSEYILPQGVTRASSLDEALNSLEDTHTDEIFVIGGAQLYAEAITHPACKRIYVTNICSTHTCDTFFPNIPDTFMCIDTSEVYTSTSGITYQYITYESS